MPSRQTTSYSRLEEQIKRRLSNFPDKEYSKFRGWGKIYSKNILNAFFLGCYDRCHNLYLDFKDARIAIPIQAYDEDNVLWKIKEYIKLLGAQFDQNAMIYCSHVTIPLNLTLTNNKDRVLCLLKYFSNKKSVVRQILLPDENNKKWGFSNLFKQQCVLNGLMTLAKNQSVIAATALQNTKITRRLSIDDHVALIVKSKDKLAAKALLKTGFFKWFYKSNQLTANHLVQLLDAFSGHDGIGQIILSSKRRWFEGRNYSAVLKAGGKLEEARSNVVDKKPPIIKVFAPPNKQVQPGPFKSKLPTDDNPCVGQELVDLSSSSFFSKNNGLSKPASVMPTEVDTQKQRSFSVQTIQ